MKLIDLVRKIGAESGYSEDYFEEAVKLSGVDPSGLQSEVQEDDIEWHRHILTIIMDAQFQNRNRN